VLEVGIIGYRNHAARLLKIIENQTDCNVKFIYHPTKSIDDNRSTNNLDDLYQCGAIFISSPNDTHFEYIEKLRQNFDGYIFCEKPPAVSLIELEKLEQFSKKEKERIFFNFNYRFSEINEIFKKHLASKQIGKILYASIIFSHGLAFKKEYKDSWRANGEKNLHNILNTVSIHFLDLINSHFGQPKYSSYNPSLISGNGNSFDTDFIVMKYSNGFSVSLLNSYASPLINEISLVGTNGYLTIRNQKLTVFSPRDNFDSNGFFIEPKIAYETNFDVTNDYNNSLQKSLDYFISHTINKFNLDVDHYDKSLSTNRMLISLGDSFTNE